MPKASHKKTTQDVGPGYLSYLTNRQSGYSTTQGHENSGRIVRGRNHSKITRYTSQNCKINSYSQSNPKSYLNIDAKKYILSEIDTHLTRCKSLSRDIENLYKNISISSSERANISPSPNLSDNRRGQSIQGEMLMYALIAPRRGTVVSVFDDAKEMKKMWKAVVGTPESNSGVLFYLNRIKAEDVLYLLEQARARFAVTSKGVLNYDGDHVLYDFPYKITENSNAEAIEYYYSMALHYIRDNDELRSMTGL